MKALRSRAVVSKTYFERRVPSKQDRRAMRSRTVISNGYSERRVASERDRAMTSIAVSRAQNDVSCAQIAVSSAEAGVF